MKRAFTHTDRLAMATRIEQLEDRRDSARIFEIILKDRHHRYSRNAEGVVLDLSALSDRTLRRIMRYLDEEVNWPEERVTQVMTGEGEPERAYRLSNYERNILRCNRRERSEAARF